MSAEHTPTPWSLGGNATIKAKWPHGETAYIATMENNHVRAANATFIVLAVNAHDDLVAALVEARLALRASNGSEEAIRTIDAAITKAEGRS